MKTTLLFLLMLPLAELSAQEGKVSIKGKAPAYKGEKAQLFSVTDHFTEMDTLLAQDSVNPENGNFELQVNVDRVRSAWVRIGNARSKIYLDPGADYEVKFPKIPEGKVPNPQEGTEVKMTFYELPRTDANNLVIDFNMILEDFFARNYRAMAVQQGNMGSYLQHRTDMGKQADSLTRNGRNRTTSIDARLDSLEKDLKERYAGIEKEWFRVHMDHALAPFRNVIGKDREAIYRRYFADKPVRHYHEEYMQHFLEFYDQHLLDFARRNDSILDLREQLRKDPRPAPILKAIKHSEYAEEKAIRELLLIDGMFDAYYDREGYPREGILAVLDSIGRSSPRKGARRMAQGLSGFLSERKRGSKAPSFKLMNRDTSIVSLKDLRGAPIYLNFWASWSETSIKEMRIIHKLHEQYGDRMYFVSISVDDKFRDMKAFLDEHPNFDWTFLYLGSHNEIEKAYRVTSLPAYFLLDPRGRFIRAPAPRPGGKARELILRTLRELKRQPGTR